MFLPELKEAVRNFRQDPTRAIDLSVRIAEAEEGGYDVSALEDLWWEKLTSLVESLKP